MGSAKSPTPDMLPLAGKKSRLDTPPRPGAMGRDNSSVITAKASQGPLGPKCHLDGPASGMGRPRQNGALGVGNESLKDAGASIASGAKAPKVNWPGVSAAAHRRNQK